MMVYHEDDNGVLIKFPLIGSTYKFVDYNMTFQLASWLALDGERCS